MAEEMRNGLSVEGRQLYRVLAECKIYTKRYEEYKAKKAIE